MARRFPDPRVLDRLRRSRVEVVPDPVEPGGALQEPLRPDPDPTPTTSATRDPARGVWARCGHCSHGFVGHGEQYGALVGWHTWAPELPRLPKYWSEIVPAPGRGPR